MKTHSSLRLSNLQPQIMTHNEENPDMLNYIEPEFTFGVELEMLYLFRRDDFEGHANRVLHGPLHGEIVQQYVSAILMHYIPHEPQQPPSLLGAVASPGGRNLIGYDNWQVVDDVSIGATEYDVRRYFDLPANTNLDNVDWHGVEAISPVYRFTDDETWLSHLCQIQHDLESRLRLGAAFNNETTGLHLHFALGQGPGGEVPLEMAKNLVIFWAI